MYQESSRSIGQCYPQAFTNLTKAKRVSPCPLSGQHMSVYLIPIVQKSVVNYVFFFTQKAPGHLCHPVYTIIQWHRTKPSIKGIHQEILQAYNPDGRLECNLNRALTALYVQMQHSCMCHFFFLHRDNSLRCDSRIIWSPMQNQG